MHGTSMYVKINMFRLEPSSERNAAVGCPV